MLNMPLFESAPELLKALAHENRLKIIELLSFGECCVEDLSSVMQISVKLVSAHLRVMRTAGLLTTRKEGVRVYYRLANSDVLELYQHIKEITQSPSEAIPIINEKRFTLTLKQLLDELDTSLLIDVREETDFTKGHIPNAINVPVTELYQWSKSYSQEDDKLIIVYCEHVYCIQAIEAIELLMNKHYRVKIYPNGLQEWKTAGFEVESKSKK